MITTGPRWPKRKPGHVSTYEPGCENEHADGSECGRRVDVFVADYMLCRHCARRWIVRMREQLARLDVDV